MDERVLSSITAMRALLMSITTHLAYQSEDPEAAARALFRTAHAYLGELDHSVRPTGDPAPVEAAFEAASARLRTLEKEALQVLRP